MRQTTTAEVRLEQGKPPSSGPAVGQPVASAAGMEPSRTKLFAAEPKKSDYVPHGLRIRGMSDEMLHTFEFPTPPRWAILPRPR
jgi:hypothetical protein